MNGTTLSFKLKSEASGQGNIIVQDDNNTTPVLSPDNLDSRGNPALVATNEELRIKLAPADTSGAGAVATAFDAGADATDDNQLRQQTTINIGGVEIILQAGISRKTAGETIEDQYAAAIRDADPNIESVTYDADTQDVVITWKAEAGNVYDDGSVFKVDGAVGSATLADSLFVATGDPQTVTRTEVQGDNSYLGTYRIYAYLNDEQLLNIGKPIDPGESGGQPDFLVPGLNTEPGPIVFKFSPTTGRLVEVNGDRVKDPENVPKLTVRGADPANPTDALLTGDTDNLRGLQLDLSDSTNWFDPASIVKTKSQDGYAKGDLIGVTFDEQGRMVASYSNGQKQNLGAVALATFENQAGLQPAGDTEWVATLASGQASLNPPGTGLNGTLRSAALEQSNVDLSAELVKLIEYQRNYQANSKTLETLNTVTQSILQI